MVNITEELNYTSDRMITLLFQFKTFLRDGEALSDAELQRRLLQGFATVSY